MKRIFICIATLIFGVVLLSGCSNEQTTGDTTNINRIGDSTLWYDEYTEVVGIEYGEVASSTMMNAYYHGYPLYYCWHEEVFYYYKDDVKYTLTPKDITCELNVAQ